MVSVAEKYVSMNERDAHEKLRSCFFSWKGEFWFLLQYQERFIAVVESIERSGHETINLAKTDESEFSIGPFNLGMINHTETDSVFFMSRRPLRRNKFGIREENSDIVHVGGERTDERNRRVFQQLYSSRSFSSMLKGNYPSYEEVLDHMKRGKIGAKAFNRSFAIERAGIRFAALKYRTATVGEVSLSTGNIELYPSYDHLKDRCSLIKGCPSVSIAKV